ncbi:MAG: helix-turn-helix domain-containing protein [Desulfotignum sp.]|nr:helix-turn-helix domain-containing protein [Desulfotignum sp.]MCF8113523.1 helix-turn-helix domain-containing protein [Desulfotignum sp.]MCF8125753.1 helix-turn-helix domain-containing protein [Desulfotignum sp.]
MELFTGKQLFILSIVFNGFFLGALISAALLIRAPRSLQSWMFTLLFTIFSLLQIHYIFFQNQAIVRYPLITLLPVIAIFLLGPVLLQITNHALNKVYQFNKKAWIHFVPVMLATVVSAIVILNTDFQQNAWLSHYYYNSAILNISCAGYFVFLAYFAVSTRKFAAAYLFTKEMIRDNPPAQAVLVIIAGMMLAFIFDGFTLVFRSTFFMELALTCLNLVIICLFFILFRYPEYPKAIQQMVEKEKKRRSYLKGVDLDVLENKISDLMENNEIFTDEALSLETLAKEAGVSKHQLSEYLNQTVRENFPTFVNRYRIQKAKEILIQNPDQKILAVAFDVGFKSKSTFNAAFSKFEGTTPARYRKNHQN